MGGRGLGQHIRVKAQFPSVTALSFTSVSKGHVGDKWAWHANPPLARCETKGWRQIFPLFHAERKGHKDLVGTSSPTTCFHIVFLAHTLSQTALPLRMDTQCTKTNSKKTIKSPAIKLGRGGMLVETTFPQRRVFGARYSKLVWNQETVARQGTRKAGFDGHANMWRKKKIA